MIKSRFSKEKRLLSTGANYENTGFGEICVEQEIDLGGDRMENLAFRIGNFGRRYCFRGSVAGGWHITGDSFQGC